MHTVLYHYTNTNISPSLFLSKEGWIHQVIQQMVFSVNLTALWDHSECGKENSPFFTSLAC